MSDRKYQQRGYQESDRRSDRGPERDGGPRSPRPPGERSEAPRGRGLGAPTASVFRCASCGEKSDLARAMALDAVCASCGTDLHACMQCAQFDSSMTNQCRKPEAPRIASKSKRNDCGFFDPRLRQEFAAEPTRSADKPAPNAARAAFDALFKS